MKIEEIPVPKEVIRLTWEEHQGLVGVANHHLKKENSPRVAKRVKSINIKFELENGMGYEMWPEVVVITDEA